MKEISIELVKLFKNPIFFIPFCIGIICALGKIISIIAKKRELKKSGF